MERMRDFLRPGIPWPWGRDRHADGYPTVPSWPGRHPITSALISAAAVVAVAVPIYKSVTSSPCGPGMIATGSPYICVGLDLRSTPMISDDRLSGLEAKISHMDSHVTVPFATIVLLADLTPDRQNIEPIPDVKRIIEGAITAVNSANKSDMAGPMLPQIKLLLANFGPSAQSWEQAVKAIKDAQRSQHIVAVTGIGQSIDNTRLAVAKLSQDQITTIGSDVTADNINQNRVGQPIPYFYRVAPTNTDEVLVALHYIKKHLLHEKIMLIRDQNTKDSYPLTLANAFKNGFGPTLHYTEPYTSPPNSLPDSLRGKYMSGQFAPIYEEVCFDQPSLIYFAGRGADLKSFLWGLANRGSCSLPRKITVMTGDDAANLIGHPFEAPTGVSIDVLFTALATGGEWPKPPNVNMRTALFHEESNYSKFAKTFQRNGYLFSDLSDGEAMTEYDAVLTAATAVRSDPVAIADPSTVAAYVSELNYCHTVPGASGLIAFGSDHNPIDKAIPILQINPDGTTTQLGLPEDPSGPWDHLHHTC